MSDLAHQVADWLLLTLRPSEGPLRIALSGGTTPKALYELLAQEPYRGLLPWDRIHVFWGDERFVPPDDARSNYRMAYTALLGHVPIPSRQYPPGADGRCDARGVGGPVCGDPGPRVRRDDARPGPAVV